MSRRRLRSRRNRRGNDLYFVMLNLFQHPFRRLAAAHAQAWTLKQVQGDGVGG
jgi:hypothetical protein